VHLIVAGLNHKTAPVEIRERCAFSAARMAEIYAALRHSDAVDSAVQLVTCNRTEVYAAAADPDAGYAALEDMLHACSGIERNGFSRYLYRHAQRQAVAHLFSVAAGLDSMILGEQQILGQVKEAYRMALEHGAVGGLLSQLFQAALHAGKKVHTRTGIGRYPVSISSAAVEMCRDIFGSLDHKQVLVVGAGETAELAIRHLMSSGVRTVIVANRSFEHACRLAAAIGGTAVHFDRLPGELAGADIVISCTAAPHAVIREDNCGAVLRGRAAAEIVIIDVAVPRDVEPCLGAIENVFLYDVDDLQGVVDRNFKERLHAAHAARGIIDLEARRFADRLAAMPLGPVINELKRRAGDIRERELSRVLGKLGDLSPAQQAAVSALSRALVNKLLHAPIAKMKEKCIASQGHVYADVIAELFDLQPYANRPQHTPRDQGK
jgi:glutamyl-tRNA reductase